MVFLVSRQVCIAILFMNLCYCPSIQAVSGTTLQNLNKKLLPSYSLLVFFVQKASSEVSGKSMGHPEECWLDFPRLTFNIYLK